MGSVSDWNAHRQILPAGLELKAEAAAHTRQRCICSRIWIGTGTRARSIGIGHEPAPCALEGARVGERERVRGLPQIGGDACGNLHQRTKGVTAGAGGSQS